MISNSITRHNRIKNFTLGLAATAVAGVMAISGPVHASSQAFDVENENPTSAETARVTVVNHEPMPADLHDEAIVRGTVSTVIEPSQASVLVRSMSYQGDNNEEPKPVVAFAYFGDVNETSSPVAALAYFGDENDSGTPTGKTHGNGALVGQLPRDDHDAEIVMANGGSLRERAVIVAASYQGDETDEPAPVIALAYQGDESEESPEPQAPLTYQGDETDDVHVVAEFITTEEVSSALV